MTRYVNAGRLTRRQLLRLLQAWAAVEVFARPAEVSARDAQVPVSGAVPRLEDWPEVGGRGRLNTWNETGILDKFPEGGLQVLWRTRLGCGGPPGYCGRQVGRRIRGFPPTARQIQGLRPVSGQGIRPSCLPRARKVVVPALSRPRMRSRRRRDRLLDPQRPWWPDETLS